MLKKFEKGLIVLKKWHRAGGENEKSIYLGVKERKRVDRGCKTKEGLGVIKAEKAIKRFCDPIRVPGGRGTAYWKGGGFNKKNFKPDAGPRTPVNLMGQRISVRTPLKGRGKKVIESNEKARA